VSFAITALPPDPQTNYKVARYGEWYIRARPDGASFDLALPPFKSWEDAKTEFVGLSLDHTARLLGVARGDLHAWGRE
jgi:hypothetical protein